MGLAACVQSNSSLRLIAGGKCQESVLDLMPDDRQSQKITLISRLPPTGPRTLLVA